MISTTPIVLNDRMGKLMLYKRSTKESVLRVRLLPDGSLETLGRVYGGAWGEDQVTVCDRFLAMIVSHLTRREAYGEYFYLDQMDVQVVNRRFERSKA